MYGPIQMEKLSTVYSVFQELGSVNWYHFCANLSILIKKTF